MRLKDEWLIFACAMLSLPLMILLLPLMLCARFGRPKRGVRIALTVSDRWPAYLQFIRLPYDLAILRAGAKVVTITPKDIEAVPELLDNVDAVIISGGEDIAPDDPLNNANSRNHNRERDDLELAVLREAEKRGMPTLCVCRGMQLLSLSSGGEIVCHDDDQRLSASHKTTLRTLGGHVVKLYERSRIRRIFGRCSIRVNSLHHQHVTDAGSLRVAGRSLDGLIESVEQTGERFVIGVQWHPELQAIFDFKEERLFKALVDAAVELK
ncbi:MAG: gamma-glutamyl-gamma-aminobutyrate hydrolase family protein [Victivallales bacterium]|nr:gamma-glutamyl-gamma-aminobutyrate hydrolase family protein [Victivallales bacterium]